MQKEAAFPPRSLYGTTKIRRKKTKTTRRRRNAGGAGARFLQTSMYTVLVHVRQSERTFCATHTHTHVGVALTQTDEVR